MRSFGGSTASGRANRRRRAVAAVVCVFLGGASVGAAVGLSYPQTSRRQVEKAFDSVGLTTAQRRATDSIIAHYACAIDSINHTIAPQVDSIRRAARDDVLEVLTEAQAAKLNRALSVDDGKHGQHRPDKHGMCDRGTDSTSFPGHTRFLRL